MAGTDDEGLSMFALWLKEQFEITGKPKNGLARVLNIHPQQVSQMLAGKRLIHPEELPQIAQYLERPLPEEFLAGIRNPKHFGEVPVIGYTALGVWREGWSISKASAAMSDETIYAPKNPDQRYAALRQLSLEIGDNSCDLIAPKGSFVNFVDYWQIRSELTAQDVVLVEQDDGSKVEVTLRRVVKHRAPRGWELQTESSERAYLNDDGSQKAIPIEERQGRWVHKTNSSISINIAGYIVWRCTPVNP